MIAVVSKYSNAFMRLPPGNSSSATRQVFFLGRLFLRLEEQLLGAECVGWPYSRGSVPDLGPPTDLIRAIGHALIQVTVQDVISWIASCGNRFC